jgi:hypothetical protein
MPSCRPGRSAILAAVLLTVLGSRTYAAQNWTAVTRQPDFVTGVWGNDAVTAVRDMQRIGLPPLKAEAAAQLAAGNRRKAELAQQGVSTESCEPLGPPTVMLRPYPFEFTFSPGRVTMLLELDGQVRRIYTDGRAHPDDPDPTYGGHSIGRWEDATLAVDTVGFLPQVEVVAGVPGRGATHIIERMHLSAPDRLTIDTTVENTELFTRAWVYSRVYERHRDWDVQEYFCAQNPRLVDSAEGSKVDLSPGRP